MSWSNFELIAHTSNVDLSFKTREADAMRQVEQLSHSTGNAVIHRFGGRIAFDDPTGPQ